jgi:phage baseplate assembly protein W
MELNVSGQLDRVVIGATGIDAIVQQVKIVCATRVGSLPLDRAFGIKADATDMPLPVAKAKASAAVIQGIETYVPGVNVLSVSWKADADQAQAGKLIPVVRIKINES